MKKIILVFCSVIFVLTLVFIVALPSEKTSFKQVSAANITMTVPAYLTERKDIDSLAVIQLANEKKQIFVLAYQYIDSITSIHDFFNQSSDLLISGMSNGNLLNHYPESINGNMAISGIINGRSNQTKIKYYLTIIKSGDSVTKIIIGIVADNSKEFNEDITNCINSIKLF